MSSLVTCDLASHDRHGHVPVPHRGAPGVLGRAVPGQQRIPAGNAAPGDPQGQREVRDILTECAWSAGQDRQLLSAQFQRLHRRFGKKGRKAAVAVAHTLLVIIWHVLHDRANTANSATTTSPAATTPRRQAPPDPQPRSPRLPRRAHRNRLTAKQEQQPRLRRGAVARPLTFEFRLSPHVLARTPRRRENRPRGGSARARPVWCAHRIAYFPVRPSWPWRAARGWMKLRVAAR